MRIVRGAAEHAIDPFDQPVRHHVLELLGFLVNLVPAHAQNLHEEQLHEPMAAQHQRGELLAGRGQTDAAVRLVLGEA